VPRVGSQIGPRAVVPSFRLLLGPFVVLAVGASLALLVGTTRTQDSFSWTIKPPLTAAILGAGYAGALLLFALTLRERVWANARIAVSGPFALSVLTLVATLIHLGKFHLRADPLPATVAWIWLIVYIVVPPAFVLLVCLELRTPGGDPPRRAAMPVWLRVVMVGYGVAGLIGGLVFFVVPARVAPHWPWAVTPLTGQAIAAWIVALGVAALHGAIEDDLVRVRAGLASFAVIGALGLLAIVRFSADMRWDAGGWLVVAVFALMLGAGGFGWLLGRTATVTPSDRLG
jgi:hypothetical protein